MRRCRWGHVCGVAARPCGRDVNGGGGVNVQARWWGPLSSPGAAFLASASSAYHTQPNVNAATAVHRQHVAATLHLHTPTQANDAHTPQPTQLPPPNPATRERIVDWSPPPGWRGQVSKVGHLTGWVWGRSTTSGVVTPGGEGYSTPGVTGVTEVTGVTGVTGGSGVSGATMGTPSLAGNHGYPTVAGVVAVVVVAASAALWSGGELVHVAPVVDACPQWCGCAGVVGCGRRCRRCRRP